MNPTTQRRVRPGRRSSLVLLSVFALAVIAGQRPAIAHDKKGKVAVVQIDTSTPLRADVTLRITYVNDGHGAKDAIATIVAELDGTSVGPVPMVATADEGTYTARVELPQPGAWLLRASSLEPETYVEQRVEIAAPPTTNPPTTNPPTTIAPASLSEAPVTDATPADTTAAPTEATAGPTNDVPSTLAPASASKGISPGLVAAAVVLVLGALSVPLLIVRRRTKARR